MAIDFTTNPGGLFPRLGRVLKVAYVLTPFEAGLPALFVGIFNQYLSTLQNVGGGLQTQADGLVRTPSGVMGAMSEFAGATVQQMVLADQPPQSLTLQSSLAEVIRQMKLGGYYVTPNVIGITPAQLSGSIGSGVLVTSTQRGDGLVQENSIAELLRLVCTADSYSGGATQGQEQFGLTGSPATAGTWDYDYPTGSGTTVSVSAVSAETDADTTANLLTNGDFESWTGSGATATLDNWTLGGASVWGTDIRQNATDPLQGTYCLQFIAGTGVNSQIYQTFNDTAGTSAAPDPLASYALNIWLRKLSGTISAGVLTFDLVDGSGTVLQDEQGVNNTFTVTCSTLTTSYVAYNTIFRLDANPPAVVRLRVRMTTALVGGDVLADSVCFAPLTAMYAGGPGFAVFSGATPFVGGDGWDITVTNNQGGASYLGTFQTGFARLFPMRDFDFLLPSTGSSLIANTLITS